MLWKNTREQFGRITISIHWLVALTVYALFALGLWMVTLGYYDGWYHQAPEIHKSIGCILFAVMLFRVIWRFISPPPRPLSSYSRFTRISAVLAHLFLYIILFCIMFSGYLISTADGQPISVFGWFAVPATLTSLPDQADTAGIVHLYLAWAVVVLSLLHGLAAIKHHFIDGDITLKRMLGRSTD
ncbi:cytochrome b [Yersinia enterocolitica]|uniref:cytochrome b n=1 Tax=Yersinia enterocolitica TaxID=630 RepID=UPI003311E674|nr:cytochrome b [Yersinia enterocolitica]